MQLRWSEEKNELLQRTRGLCFEEVEQIIASGEELDILPHPSRPNQKILVVRIHGYVHAVPFITDGEGIFLKTIFPSRDIQRQYGGGK